MSHFIEICHETPKALFSKTRRFNDYDYYLDFLWEDEEYRKFFERRILDGRRVILDNSLFEFHPIVPPMSRFYEHIKALNLEKSNNVEYIVTDVLDNADRTIANFEEWSSQYRKTAPGICIGVAQGSSVSELRKCYKYMSKHADKIAIPFDSGAFDELVSEEEHKGDKLIKWALGRQRFIRDLVCDNLWCETKPHHLLGCSYAWEFGNSLYKEISIETLDTSSPVVCGITGVPYGENGNNTKPSVKLCDLINHQLSEEEEDLIMSNIRKFREIVNG